jgi:hypothetical protein
VLCACEVMPFFLFCLVKAVHIFDLMLLQTKLKTNGNRKNQGHNLIDSLVFGRSICHYRLECLGTTLAAGQVYSRDSTYPILQKGTGLTDLPILRGSRFH